MGIKDILKSALGGNREDKDTFKEMEKQFRMQKKLEEMQKSSNERELERFAKEEREEQIKEQLEIYRKQRQQDINFNHNALNIKNITNHTDWEVMKERNMFKGNRNMFSNNENIMRNNPNLLKNNRSLCGI